MDIKKTNFGYVLWIYLIFIHIVWTGLRLCPKNENQVLQGRLVDALALGGDEGRDTLR